MRYKYRLLYRPFGIGTYPPSDFLEWEDDGSKFGILVYSRELTKNEIYKFELGVL